MADGLHITSDTLTPGLKAFPDKVDNAIGQTINFFTPKVEGAAKSGATWTDRTGNARGLLRAQADHDPGRSHSIILSHGVPYGIWLEVRNEGRLGIIEPTIKTQGSLVWVLIRDLFQRMA